MHRAADRSHTICILSVPATMTCHDLLTFTAACHEDIQHFRILRDNSPNQYMALITMRSSVSIRLLLFKVIFSYSKNTRHLTKMQIKILN